MSPGKLQLPIALDAMGGDSAPACVLRGAEMALIRHPGIRFLLYGNRHILEPLVARIPLLKAAGDIVHTEAVIAGDDKPSLAVRRGRDSSMWLSIESVKEGRSCAVVSAGNTGALMAMSKLILRTLPGISRPAIAALFPSLRGECVMLDLGANVESDAHDLYRFAIMGDAFARAVLGLSRPRIGLLNVGSEDLKGHDEVKAAFQLLKESATDINFHGFVEGNDIAEGTVDVVVTDGFTGNVALKTAEGTARLIRTYLREAFASSAVARGGALLASGALKAVKEKLDDRKRNGAMFLGLNGIAVKSHGGADATSFCNAISVAVELVTHHINARITQEIKLSAKPQPALETAGGEPG
ncbi:MAG: phosphate acyltransferase PlsX [Pseudomonadota bacterium]|nr:phosphate acyltransferase PlsX [Pseudomonadota bacterium]MDE3038406.1 phosphate acyltransferase PlsX [Pseudomonadota bacterium]